MSTVVESTRPTDGAVVPQYNDKNAAGYVAPPPGMRYVRVNSKVVIGEDGKPVVTKSKAKGKGRNKKSKAVYAVPATKLPSADTPDFKVLDQAKLKIGDFADPLDYHKWEVWYYTERAKIAQRDADAMASLGDSKEARQDSLEDMRIITAARNLLARRQGGAKSRLADLLGELYAEGKTE
jgi:hypothetical protein